VINKDGSHKAVAGENRNEYTRNNTYAPMAPSSAPEPLYRNSPRSNSQQQVQSAPSSSLSVPNENVQTSAISRSKSFVNQKSPRQQWNLQSPSPQSPFVQDNYQIENQPYTQRTREKPSSASATLEKTTNGGTTNRKQPLITADELQKLVENTQGEQSYYVPTVYEKPRQPVQLRSGVSLRRGKNTPIAQPDEDAESPQKLPFAPKNPVSNPFQATSSPLIQNNPISNRMGKPTINTNNLSNDSVNEMIVETPKNVVARQNSSVSRKVFHIEQIEPDSPREVEPIRKVPQQQEPPAPTQRFGARKLQLEEMQPQQQETPKQQFIWNQRNEEPPKRQEQAQQFGARKVVQEEYAPEQPTQRFGARKVVKEEYAQEQPTQRMGAKRTKAEDDYAPPKQEPRIPKRNNPREDYAQEQPPSQRLYRNQEPEQDQYARQQPQPNMQPRYSQPDFQDSPSNYNMEQNGQFNPNNMYNNSPMNFGPAQFGGNQYPNPMMNNYGAPFMNQYGNPMMNNGYGAPPFMTNNNNNKNGKDSYTTLMNNFASVLNQYQQPMQQNSYAKMQKQLQEEPEAGPPSLYSSKRPRDVNFKPYGISDYKKMTSGIQHMKLGGLGPDLQNEELLAKQERMRKMKEYGREATMVNINKMMLVPSNTSSPRDIPMSSSGPSKSRIPLPPTQRKPSARDKALEFASRIPKPKIKRQFDEEIEIEGEPEPMSEIEMLEMKHRMDNDWIKSNFH
jgi:hypothetical protein